MVFIPAPGAGGRDSALKFVAGLAPPLFVFGNISKHGNCRLQNFAVLDSPITSILSSYVANPDYHGEPEEKSGAQSFCNFVFKSRISNEVPGIARGLRLLAGLMRRPRAAALPMVEKNFLKSANDIDTVAPKV